MLCNDCTVHASGDGSLWQVLEYDKPMESELDVFKMTSYYYVCRVDKLVETYMFQMIKDELLQP